MEIVGIQWMWDKIEGLANGKWIRVAIRRGNLLIVCDGSYQPNMDENRGETAWVIHCNDTDIYTWGSLTTTSQVATAYISELTGLYAIL